MGPPTSPAVPSWRDLLDRAPAWLRRPAAAGLAAVAVLAVVAAAVALLRPPAGPAPRLTLPVAGAAGSAGGEAPAGMAAGAGGPREAVGGGGGPPAAGAVLTVHAAGAVSHPGVYSVPSGARVGDLLTAAGGPLPEADVDRLNLAAKLADGDRVLVPRQGQPAEPGLPGAGGPGSVGAGGGSSTTAAGPIDLNTATVEQLDTLPGVGPATAQAIVTYRNRHGRFRSVTELLEVPGIGPAKLEAVRPLVRV